MSAGGRSDPYRGFRFRVEVDSLIVAGFAEVSGLETALETEDYQEGGVNTHTHKLPTRFSHPPLVLKRGLTESLELWDWVQAALNGQITRKSGRVLLLDSNQEPAWGWAFTDAYPVKWVGPTLSADQGAVAMETLELAHTGISKAEGVPSG